MVASGAYLLPGDVTSGMVWTLRSTAPFSARAGVDLTPTARTPITCPARTRGRATGISTSGLVNAWRATRGLEPIEPGQDQQERLQPRGRPREQGVLAGGKRRIEGIFQIFNLFGRDNLGGIGSSFQTNALSDSFGQLLTAQNRQQAEIAVRVMF